MGQQPGTLRGVISALRLVEKLGCIPPTVRPVHWLMARGAATTTAAPRPTQVWAELVTLRLMARNIGTTLDWFCLGLAVISFATLLRVGEAASVRPVDIWTRCTLGFFDDRKGRRLGHSATGGMARCMARGDGSPVGLQQARIGATHGCRVRPSGGDPWLAGCHGMGIHGMARLETRRSCGHAGVRSRHRQHRGGWAMGQRGGGPQVRQRAPWPGILPARQRALAHGGI